MIGPAISKKINESTPIDLAMLGHDRSFRRFLYFLIQFVTTEEVFIISVFHQSLEPGSWREKGIR